MKSKYLVGIIFCLFTLQVFAVEESTARNKSEDLIDIKTNRVSAITKVRHITVYNHKQDVINNKRSSLNEENFSGTNCTGDDDCSESETVTSGTIDSYIEDYSMFAVIGTGIRLPEDQIESYQGIDDQDLQLSLIMPNNMTSTSNALKIVFSH